MAGAMASPSHKSPNQSNNEETGGKVVRRPSFKEPVQEPPAPASLAQRTSEVHGSFRGWLWKECDDIPCRAGCALRFVDDSIEVKYACSCARRLATAHTRIASTLILVPGLTLGLEVFAERMGRESYSNDAVESISMTAQAILCVWGFLILCGRRSLKWSANEQPLAVELVTMVTLVLVTGCVVHLDRSFVSHFHSRDTWSEPRTENWLLVVFGLMVVLCHSHLSLRVCVLWPLQVGVVAVYGYTEFQEARRQDSPVTDPLSRALVLVVIVLCSWIIRRNIEVSDRTLFYEMHNQAALSVKSRVLLEGLGMMPQLKDDSYSNGMEKTLRRASTRNSLRSVNSTNTVFTNMGEDNVSEKYKELLTLGKNEHWLIKLEDLSIDPLAKLGQGGFGMVFGGVLQSSPVAVKVARQPPAPTNMEDVPVLLNEIRVLRRVRHPNIVIFHGVVIDLANWELAIVMEFVVGRVLNEVVLDNKNIITDSRRWSILEGMCRALEYLHGMNPQIIHGDLKPGNIMIEVHGTFAKPRLLDFGLARVLQGRVKPLSGTLRWMAPEVGTSIKERHAAADIFSLGRVIHFIVTGCQAFEGCNRRQMARMIRLGKQPELRWEGDSTMLGQAHELVQLLTHLDPSARPEISEVHQILCHWTGFTKEDEDDKVSQFPSLKTFTDSMVMLRTSSKAEANNNRGSQKAAAPPAAQSGDGRSRESKVGELREMPPPPRITRRTASADSMASMASMDTLATDGVNY